MRNLVPEDCDDVTSPDEEASGAVSETRLKVAAPSGATVISFEERKQRMERKRSPYIHAREMQIVALASVRTFQQLRTEETEKAAKNALSAAWAALNEAGKGSYMNPAYVHALEVDIARDLKSLQSEFFATQEKFNFWLADVFSLEDLRHMRDVATRAREGKLRISATQVAALEAIEANGPASRFDFKHHTICSLIRAGLVQRCKEEQGKFVISQAGRRALAAHRARVSAGRKTDT